MIEVVARGRTLPEAYHNALTLLEDFGLKSPCSDQGKPSEQREVSMTICVASPLAEPRISRLFVGGPYDLERYRQEMLDGIFDFKIGDGWEYTYHDRMVNFNGINQIKFVIDTLTADPHSRRACITLRTRSDISTVCKDPTCLQHIQYFIRNGKLDCSVLFRSNDACKATFMNAFALICLQEKIAKELGVEVGSYTHRANSFHCYERDYALLFNYARAIKRRDDKALTYSYKDEYADLMAEEQPRVAGLVEQLRRMDNDERLN